MSGILKAASEWLASYGFVELSEPWYTLTREGRKRVLCLPNAPGTSVLYWRYGIAVRLRGSQLAERFETRIRGVSRHASVWDLLHNEGPDVFPDLIPEAHPFVTTACMDKAIRTQLLMFSEQELACIGEHGVLALQVVPVDASGRELVQRRPWRKTSTAWYTSLLDE